MWNETLNLKKQEAAAGIHQDYRKNLDWAREWIDEHVPKFSVKYKGLLARVGKEIMYLSYSSSKGPSFAHPIALNQPSHAFLNEAQKAYKVYLNMAKEDSNTNQMTGSFYEKE